MTGQRGSGVERVRAALQQHGSRGGPVKWQCPVHDDNDPSLTVTQGDKGALVKCRSNDCALDDILAALKLTRRDLFDSGDLQDGGITCRRHDYKTVTFYEYVSADSASVVQKVERKRCTVCGEKTFLPHRPTAAGGWECKAPDQRDRVPYHLDEVLKAKADGVEILLNEGEKACDRAREAGLVATTFAGGAEAKLLPQFAELLAGARITIVQDRDRAGEKCASARRDFLNDICDVRIMLPAVTSPKADLYDHLEARFGLGDLVPLDRELEDSAVPASEEIRHGKLAGLGEITLDPTNQATELVSLARKRFELFRSDDGREYAVEKRGPNIALQLGSKGRFAKRLARYYITEKGKAPGDDALTSAVQIIAAFLDDEDPRRVALRVGWHKPADGKRSIVLDLGRADGRCVIVTADGWEVADRSPIPFRRGKTGPLPIPVCGKGDGLAQLKALLNANEDVFRLAIGCVVSALVPGITYPIPVLSGEHGTAKTTAAKLLMWCIDPGRVPGRLPKDERNFGVRAWNGHVHVFDNLSDLQEWQSDMLCRASTGDDTGERTLYTNDELTSMPYQVFVIITAMDLGVVKPDFADREVALVLKKIPDAKRRTERDEFGDDEPGVEDEFHQAHPEILAALLDLLSGVMKYRPKGIELPRMASFAKVLAALDLRYDNIHGKPHPRPLFPMYKALAKRTVAESGRDDMVGAAILSMMLHVGQTWTGTAADLLAAITRELPPEKQEKPPHGWPASPQAFGHRISKLITSLRVNGVEVTKGRHTQFGQEYTLERVILPPSVGGSSSDHHDRQDDAPEQGKQPDEAADELLPADELPPDRPDELPPADEEPESSSANWQGSDLGRYDVSDEPDVLTNFPQPAEGRRAVVARAAPSPRFGDGHVATLSNRVQPPDGQILALLQNQLGAELIETTANGHAADADREIRPCIAPGCPRRARPDTSTCRDHAREFEPRRTE